MAHQATRIVAFESHGIRYHLLTCLCTIHMLAVQLHSSDGLSSVLQKQMESPPLRTRYLVVPRTSSLSASSLDSLADRYVSLFLRCLFCDQQLNDTARRTLWQ